MTTKEKMKVWDSTIGNLANLLGNLMRGSMEEEEETGLQVWKKLYEELKTNISYTTGNTNYEDAKNVAGMILSTLEKHETLAVIYAKIALLGDVLEGMLEEEEE